MTAGRFELVDLGSTNGTVVDGERLRAAGRVLDAGDIIAIGDTRMVFVAEPETEAKVPRPGARRSQIVPLEAAVLRIGRDPSNGLVLEHPNVSRFHAELRPAGDGYRLADLSSRNGTWVDGRAIRTAALQAGSEVGIGPYRLVFDGRTLLARDDHGALRLDAEGVAVSVKGRQILHSSSLTIEPGQFVAVVGESGSGKSTLIKALAGVTRPTQGTVTVNGEPVHSRLSDIGYLPQDETVHQRLTVREALSYAAKLRLPVDAEPGEFDSAVDRVLDEVALTEHADTYIGSLSGGQRKRAGLAVELLNRPSLLFLDEPTTGLDPGLESRMMELLRRLADGTRAVTVITHATRNLGLCDKLIVIGRGGHLCFEGLPEEALEFFGVGGYDEIYLALSRDGAKQWAHRFEQRRPPAVAERPTPPRARSRTRGRPLVHQARVLGGRYARLFVRDRRNLLILLGQVPLAAVGTAALFERDVFEWGANPDKAGDAAQLLFLAVTLAVWFGSIDAAREIIKEKSIFVRESAVGVRLDAYLLSKVALLFTLALLQVGLLAAILFGLRPLSDQARPAWVVSILALTAFAAVGVGLLISAAVRTEDQAVSFIPLALIPQLLFAGAIVPLKDMSGAVEAGAGLVFARWSFAGAGSAAEMNGFLDASGGRAAAYYGRDFFDLPPVAAGLVLLVFLAVFLAGSAGLLARGLRRG